MNKPRSFPELLLGPDMAALEHIVQRGKQLRRLSALIQERLGPELESHYQVANIRGNTLVLVVSTTAWATRLRYQVPNLLQRLQLDERLNAITEIQIRVSPENTPHQATEHPRRATMSADAAYCLRQCADSVEDEQLRSALNRLANRQAKKN